MLTSLQAQADGTGTIAGSAIEDFLSIAGYETPGGGGGGGSSDFSTALVTITFEGEFCPLQGCYATSDDFADSYPSATFQSGDTAAIILYKGKCVTFVNMGTVTDTTGDIEYDSDLNAYIISGDGSIAITGDH